MNFLELLLLSFIEGLTEFLPISSTGHLILTSAWLGIAEEGFIKSFNVIIQVGAILSVVVLYWRRFLPDLPFYKKLFVAFLPAAVIGLAVKSKIDLVLGSVEIVGWSMLIGGFILIWSDRFFAHPSRQKKKIKDLSLLDCFKIGFLQCFAFIPGVSRSGATIIGGMLLGLNRKEAAEFSFFLAVPTLAGAAVVKGWGAVATLDASQWGWILAGTVLSFIFALLAIQFFMKIITHQGFRYFGYYRVILGLLILFFAVK